MRLSVEWWQSYIAMVCLLKMCICTAQILCAHRGPYTTILETSLPALPLASEAQIPFIQDCQQNTFVILPRSQSYNVPSRLSPAAAWLCASILHLPSACSQDLVAVILRPSNWPLYKILTVVAVSVGLAIFTNYSTGEIWSIVSGAQEENGGLISQNLRSAERQKVFAPNMSCMQMRTGAWRSASHLNQGNKTTHRETRSWTVNRHQVNSILINNSSNQHRWYHA